MITILLYMNNFIKRKYIKMWCNHCQIIQEVEHEVEQQNTMLLENSNVKIGLVKNYIILTILAINEILTQFKNPDYELANYGLDLHKEILHKLLVLIEIDKNDDDTKKIITKLCMMKNNEAVEEDLEPILLDSNCKLKVLQLNNTTNNIDIDEKIE